MLLLILYTFWAAGARLPYPQNRRQVPQHIRNGQPELAYLQFGFEMGTGIRTYLPSPAPLIAISVVATAAFSPLLLLFGLSFGGTRGIVPLLYTARSEARWEQWPGRTLPRILVGIVLAAGWQLLRV